MNSFVYKYYHEKEEIEGIHDPFFEVIYVDDKSSFSYEELKEKAPHFTRGWYELCLLPLKDRLEFLHDFWKAHLPYVPHVDSFLTSFFSNVDDVGVFL